MLAYAVKLIPDDNGTVRVTSPDFPELTTFGEDNNDALLHTVAALEEAIAARIADQEDIPKSSKGKFQVAVSTQIALKVLLYKSMRDQGIRKAVLARRLHCHAPQVDRLLDIRHASRIDQLDAAFSALGQRVRVEALPDNYPDTP